MAMNTDGDPRTRTVRLKKPHGGSGTTNTRFLTVPARIASLVDDGTVFVPELTPEGILFRVESGPPLDLPRWLVDGKRDEC